MADAAPAALLCKRCEFAADDAQPDQDICLHAFEAHARYMG